MIHHDCIQGSPAWEKLRLGIPTASGFHRLFQPHRRKPSRQRDIYLLELVDEFLTGKRDEQFENEWTRRGHELEAVARFDYEMSQGAAVRKVGFVTRDDGRVGGSPDGLIGSDGVLEIKCASPQIHRTFVDGKDPGHLAQCQGYLYLCERQYVDLWLYDQAEPVLKRIERDEDYISAFIPVLDQFLKELDEAKQEVSDAYRSVSA